ncbi:hypothetical protein FRC11_006456 [Ceratobasidium sp. 423]|nr:hypothetical protein FRC11_006456 [Ceratobasidium sp. 423]
MNSHIFSASASVDNPRITVDAHESDNDSTYEPGQPRTPRSGSTALTTYTTPPYNIQYGTGVSDAAKDRLTQNSFKGQLCSITWSGRSLECAHVLRRSTVGGLLTTLEYAWGVKFGTLNLDTTQNMMWLSPHLHRYFDAEDWALVPSLAILKAIQAESVRQLSFFPKTKFTRLYPREHRDYDFVHFKSTTEPLFRVHSTISPGYSMHSPPYSTLSPIKSHVHPYFVICSVARKDKKHYPQLNQSNSNGGYEPLSREIVERVRICRTIHDLWLGQESVAVSARKKQTTPSPSLHSSAHSSTSRRSNPDRKAKRKRDDNQEDNRGSPIGRNGATSSPLADTLPTPREVFDLGGKMAFQGDRYQASAEPYLEKVKSWLVDLDQSEYLYDLTPGREAEVP